MLYSLSIIITATIRHSLKSELICNQSPRTSVESQEPHGRNPTERSTSVRTEPLRFSYLTIHLFMILFIAHSVRACCGSQDSCYNRMEKRSKQ